MAKKHCVACNKELSIISYKTTISDGVVCGDCLRSAGISELTNPKQYNADSMNALIKRRSELVKSFLPTKKIGTYLKIDTNNKIFKVGRQIFAYDDLLSFELMENNHTIVEETESKKSKGKKYKGICNLTNICHSMKIKLTLKNAHCDTAYINFISSERKTSSLIYKAAQESAQKCLSELQIIADVNQTADIPQTIGNTPSSADEILKYKQLLDAGAITESEFEQKKKQLLGL